MKKYWYDYIPFSTTYHRRFFRLLVKPTLDQINDAAKMAAINLIISLITCMVLLIWIFI